MKILVLGALIAATASAQSADTSHPEATVSVEARASAVIPGSSQQVTKSVPISSSCAYVSHRTEVLERQPVGPVDNRPEAVTSYTAALRRTASGRIDAVALTVLAHVPPSLEPSAIAVRLSVVMRCE